MIVLLSRLGVMKSLLLGWQYLCSLAVQVHDDVQSCYVRRQIKAQCSYRVIFHELQLSIYINVSDGTKIGRKLPPSHCRRCAA